MKLQLKPNLQGVMGGIAVGYRKDDGSIKHFGMIKNEQALEVPDAEAALILKQHTAFMEVPKTGVLTKAEWKKQMAKEKKDAEAANEEAAAEEVAADTAPDKKKGSRK